MNDKGFEFQYDPEKALRAELAEANARTVMEFSEEEVPQFTQGYRPHEMVTEVTAERCTGLVNLIVELRAELAATREKLRPAGAEDQVIYQAIADNYNASSAEPVKTVAVFEPYVGPTHMIPAKKYYTAPPNLAAAVAAAREQDARVCGKHSDEAQANGFMTDAGWANQMAEEIRALQDPDGLAALRGMLTRMFVLTIKHYDDTTISADELIERVLKGK